CARSFPYYAMDYW
nr:immunoglobulin heavy chain junction region [Mus musculus]MBK4184799.1 immunoglobulin heavy chain junction region [Mus musculus]